MNLFLDTKNNMPCYETTPQDLSEMYAEYNQKFSSSNMMNSKTVYDRKESRLAGILGEIVFKRIYRCEKSEDADITFDFKFHGAKVDTKCKYRSVPPTKEYEASFFSYQAHDMFHAEYYYFMSTIPNYKYVWLCGYIAKKDILDNPHKEIWKAGQTDKSNGMTFKKETICLKYKYLEQVSINLR